MFDLAIVHRPGLAAGNQDLGRILEAMLYYERVHLILSGQLFSGLWDLLGPADFAALLGHPGLTATVTPEMTSVLNNTQGGVTTHRPVAIRLSGRAGRLIPEHDTVGSLLNLIQGNPNRSDGTRSQVSKLLRLTRQSRYAEILGGDASSRARFYALARDPETLKLFVRGWANAHGCQINEATFTQMRIEIMEVGQQLMVASSHPLSQVVKGWNETSEWGAILNSLQDYAIDLYLSSSLSGDIITDPSVAAVATARLDLTIQRATRNKAQISAFEEMAFEQAHGFAQAFNTRLITLREALTIIDESHKFRTWTRGLAPDTNLLTEYHRAITRETTLKLLPASIARFGLFNFAGLASDAVLMPGSGLGLSAIDTFVVERLIRGWRPNVFVRKLQRRLDKARERVASG